MSASDPNSSIFLTDTAKQIKTKVSDKPFLPDTQMQPNTDFSFLLLGLKHSNERTRYSVPFRLEQNLTKPKKTNQNSTKLLRS